MAHFDKFVGEGVGQNLLVQLVDDLLYVFPLFIVAKSDSLSVTASSCRASYSMEVAFGLSGETEVEDSFDS